MTPAELDACAPGFPWSAWLAAAEVGEARRIVVRQNDRLPEARERSSPTLRSRPCRPGRRSASSTRRRRTCPGGSSTARFEFRTKELGGQPEERPRWRRGTQLVDSSSLGEVVGKEYVARYFPPDIQGQDGGAGRPAEARAARPDRKSAVDDGRDQGQGARKARPCSGSRSATPTNGATIRRSRSIRPISWATSAAPASSDGPMRSQSSTSRSIRRSGA